MHKVPITAIMPTGNAEGDLAIGPLLFQMSQVSNQLDVMDRTSLVSKLLSLPGASTTMIAAAGLLCIGAVTVLSAQSGLELKSNLANPMLLNLGTLKQMGVLVEQKVIEHNYPHCWRCREPLIYRAMEAWYLSITTLKDELLALANGAAARCP